MNSILISFDTKLINFNFASISGQKSQRIGYYKKDHTYVFTTESLHPKKRLVTDIKSIANLLNQSTVSKKKLDLQLSIHSLSYMQKVHGMINKRNFNLCIRREGYWYQFFLKIPFINQLVRKYLFNSITLENSTSSTLMTHFISESLSIENNSQLLEKIANLIKETNKFKPFSKFDSSMEALTKLHQVYSIRYCPKEVWEKNIKTAPNDNLGKVKDKLLEMVIIAKAQFNRAFPGIAVGSNIWWEAQNIILESYENRLKEITPGLHRAAAVIELDDNLDNILAALKITEKTDLLTGEKNYQQLLSELASVPKDCENLLAIAESAKKVIQKVFKTWFIKKIQEFNASPTLLDVFNSDDASALDDAYIDYVECFERWKNSLYNEEADLLNHVMKRFDSAYTEKMENLFPQLKLEKRVTEFTNFSALDTTRVNFATKYDEYQNLRNELLVDNDPPDWVLDKTNKDLKTLNKYFAIWINHHLLYLSSIQWPVKIDKIFGADTDKYQAYYKTIFPILKNDSKPDSLKMITVSYEDYLKTMISFCFKLGTDQEMEIRASLILGVTEDRVEIGSLITKIDEILKLVKNWDEFQVLSCDIAQRQMQPLYHLAQIAFEKVVVYELEKIYPAYRHARIVGNLSYRDKAIGKLAAEKQFEWFRANLAKLKMERLEEAPKKVRDYIQGVTNQIEGEFSSFDYTHFDLKQTELKNRYEKPKEERFFDKWFRPDYKLFLNDHMSDLLYLLSQKDSDQESIRKRYKELKNHLRVYPHGQNQIVILRRYYDNYKRSQSIKAPLKLFLDNLESGKIIKKCPEGVILTNEGRDILRQIYPDFLWDLYYSSSQRIEEYFNRTSMLHAFQITIEEIKKAKELFQKWKAEVNAEIDFQKTSKRYAQVEQQKILTALEGFKADILELEHNLVNLG